MNEYVQMEETFNKEKSDMEQTINDVKQTYEEKLQ